MKNLNILISEHFFRGLTSLKEVSESIRRSIGFFLTKIDLKIVSRELLSLTNLTRAQTFYIYESTDVIMINKMQTWYLQPSKQ